MRHMRNDPSEHHAKTVERRAAVFQNGRSRAIRIPKDFEFDGDEVMIRRVEGELVIRPVHRKSLSAALRRLLPLPPEDQIEVPEDLPLEPVDF